MKSYYDHRGNLIPGVSILEACLADNRKAEKLIAVLNKFEMRIVPEAEIKNKKVDWVVPISW